jgi:hypothetical protein
LVVAKADDGTTVLDKMVDPVAVAVTATLTEAAVLLIQVLELLDRDFQEDQDVDLTLQETIVTGAELEVVQAAKETAPQMHDTVQIKKFVEDLVQLLILPAPYYTLAVVVAVVLITAAAIAMEELVVVVVALCIMQVHILTDPVQGIKAQVVDSR